MSNKFVRVSSFFPLYPVWILSNETDGEFREICLFDFLSTPYNMEILWAGNPAYLHSHSNESILLQEERRSIREITENGVRHRDLLHQPSNILWNPVLGCIQIIDFHRAHLVNPTLRSTLSGVWRELSLRENIRKDFWEKRKGANNSLRADLTAAAERC